ncbi:hypothetical protein [Parabacteroides sp. AF48-14]|uniref:hypothetical protein n=1 Tax=Parabacteroides sp. AF48-14 TaxID=2292052 RepID=UPI0013142B4E|nr:hypothetical protein [Parabacteroides sp. AF48-14]
MKSSVVRVRVNEYLNLKLNEIAQAMNVDKSTVIRAAVTNLINRVVDEDGNIKITKADT